MSVCISVSKVSLLTSLLNDDELLSSVIIEELPEELEYNLLPLKDWLPLAGSLLGNADDCSSYS